MKFGVFVAMVSLMSLPAFADQLCGTVSAHQFGPDCKQGEICPQWRSIGYDITPMEVGTDPVALSADNFTVLQDFEQDNGQTICVEGSKAPGSPETFKVDSVDAFGPRAAEGAITEKAAAPVAPQQWASGQTELDIANGGATIQFTCGKVTIASWAIGTVKEPKVLHGEDHPGPISEGPGTPVRVTAVMQGDGTLRVQVGTKAAAGTYVFKKGKPTRFGLRCL